MSGIRIHIDRLHVAHGAAMTALIGYEAFTRREAWAWWFASCCLAMSVWCVWRRFVQGPEYPAASDQGEGNEKSTGRT